MIRSLVISDLHIGGDRPTSGSVLTAPAPLQRLLETLEHYERLVLLGDTLELYGPPRAVRGTLAVAAPILQAIGAKLGRDREVLIVPGNHDKALVHAWAAQHAGELRTATAVPLDATPVLTYVASLLAPARVRVSYPGAWLADRVWATHGHYLDPHLYPVSAYGLARREVRRALYEPASVREYERTAGRRAGGIGHALRAPLLELLRPGLSPLVAALLDRQMRHQAMPAFAHVVRRLGVDADFVLFGHVHRLGPLPGDDLREWALPAGGPRIANTGSWIYEPRLVARVVAAPHPYWPGGAITLRADGELSAVGLLAELPASALGR